MAAHRTWLLRSIPRILPQQSVRLRPLARTPAVALKLWSQRYNSTEAESKRSEYLQTPLPDHVSEPSHLNPSPEDYSRFIFQDKCRSTIYAGAGGHGCVSFLREKYVEEGPPNGGDGGSGGSIYIQAVEGMTSLHKLARRGIIKAGRGKNGQGKSKGGKRGNDVLLQVPIGTVVREVDPLEPKAPIYLDLSQHMDKPILLAAGGVGGLGNPHFVTRNMNRPTFASRGEGGMRLELEFELKLLADVGLVGKPNAGKSTLLRSLTNSRTRVGNWEFTTLSPNIGTVVIDNHKGRPLVESKGKARRTNFTIADIPGLIEDAHLDKGLGLGFLRHIERAGILAFVVDLSAGDPVQGLKNLWHELGEYERVRDAEEAMKVEGDDLTWTPPTHGLPELQSESAIGELNEVASKAHDELPALNLPPIHTKPWFVVATKADLPETQERFKTLRDYLAAVKKGEVEHPGGHPNGWREKVCAVPVSAIRGEGVAGIPKLVVELLD
ncbi:uncharacterized protein An01g13830 [Aspergillus niger]|uniref:Contig An01c0440, genomic contig n=2 Tax=Aspergillus niger TaxID=5061 RepID=A2QB44_ASPNC|nr:uncharacterized protein An01g13830 [Aspergillus niger]CAK37388.1 unnamed protein product [Aspergillus niger]